MLFAPDFAPRGLLWEPLDSRLMWAMQFSAFWAGYHGRLLHLRNWGSAVCSFSCMVMLCASRFSLSVLLPPEEES